MKGVKTSVRELLMLACVSLFGLSLAGCGGGSSSDPASGSGNTGSSGNGSSGSGTATQNEQGTVVFPNGSSGVAVVHIEDANGALLATPVVTNISAAGPVTLVAEPADFSQGLVIGAQDVQTFNNAATSPQITDDVQMPSGAGTPISASVIADTTFSVIQTTQLQSYFSTCFTGGLHLTETAPGSDQPALPPAGQATDIAWLVSPDGSRLVGFDVAGGFDFTALSPMTTAHGENTQGTGSVAGPIPSITGRGALAWDAGSDTVVAGGPDGSLTVISGIQATQNGDPVPASSYTTNSMYLPGTPAVASVAYAPNGQYVVVATASGLFIVSVSGSGVPSVIAGPLDPSYTLSDGSTYQLDHAQSIAITADGNFLVALTDEPSPTNGTLVAMSIDASGNIGAVGMIQSGFLATQGVDDLFAH